jgi:hypothetical protein
VRCHAERGNEDGSFFTASSQSFFTASSLFFSVHFCSFLLCSSWSFFTSLFFLHLPVPAFLWGEVPANSGRKRNRHAAILFSLGCLVFPTPHPVGFGLFLLIKFAD